jgi:hypothetical protein
MSRTRCSWRFANPRDDLVRRLARCDFVACDPAIDQRDDANRMRYHTWIVGREDKRHAMSIPQVAHHVHENLGVFAVEVGGRLVGQDQGGAGRDRSCYGHTLLLPTREFAGSTVG